MWRLRRLVSRKPLDDALDWARFRIDTFPRSVRWLQPLRLPELQCATYQELPWVGLGAGRRAEATTMRWARMQPIVEQLGVQSALDLGANVGWFTFTLARSGIPSIAVERDARFVRIGLYARKKLADPRASFLVMDLSPQNVRVLPPADCVLLLSVWHHVVRDNGLPTATALLSGAWERTRRVLFFESGEREMPASWGLPVMEPDAGSWLAGYLAETCEGAHVVHLGLHDALGPNNEPCRRNLFAAIRQP
jgi:hypothetical protein